MQRIPEIEKSATGKNSAEKVNNYLMDSPSRFQQVLTKTHNYIKMENITHYINGIDLGAAVYSVSVSRSAVRRTKLGGEIGVNELAGVGAGAASMQKNCCKQKRRFSIGQLERLRRGRGEGVLGYSLLPLFTLVCDERSETRKVLQQATMFYLDRNRKCS